MYLIDYRLAIARQDRLMEEAALRAGASQNSQGVGSRRQFWAARRTQRWLCELGYQLVALGLRLEGRQPLAVQCCQEQQ